VLGALFAAWRADRHGARRRLGIKPPENDDAIGQGKVEIDRRNTQGSDPAGDRERRTPPGLPRGVREEVGLRAP